MVRVLFMDISGVGEAQFRRLLDRASAERRARAERYLRWEDKVRCLVAEVLIRCAVERVLSVTEFSVEEDAYGKPYVKGQEGFHFNLSHSGDWVVLAYGDGPVGIDVQRIGDPAKVEKVCRSFALEEAAFVMEAEGRERLERFYGVWTAKESYLKYLGVGLRKSLGSFSVLPDGDHLRVRFSHSIHEGYCLTLCAVEPVAEFSWKTAPELLRELGTT